MIENCNWRRGQDSTGFKFVEISFHGADWDQPRLTRGLPSGEEESNNPTDVAAGVTSEESERSPKRAKLETGAWKDAEGITVWIDNRLLVKEDQLSTKEGIAAVQEWADAMKAIGKHAPNVEICALLLHPNPSMCFPVKALTAFSSETTKLKMLHMTKTIPFRGEKTDFLHLQNILQNHCVHLEELSTFGKTIPCAREVVEKEIEVAGSLAVAPTSLKRFCIKGSVFTDANASLLCNLSRCSALECLHLDITLAPSVLKIMSQIVAKGCPKLAFFSIGIAPRNPKLPPTPEELEALKGLAGVVVDSKILYLQIQIHNSLTKSNSIGEIMKEMLRYNYFCRFFSLEVFGDGESNADYYEEAKPLDDSSLAMQWKSEVETFVRLNRTRRSCLLLTPDVASYQSWIELLADLGSPPGSHREHVGQGGDWRELIEGDEEAGEEEAEDDNPLVDKEVLTGLYLFLLRHVSDFCSSTMLSNGHVSDLPQMIPILKSAKQAHDAILVSMANKARLFVRVAPLAARLTRIDTYAIFILQQRSVLAEHWQNQRSPFVTEFSEGVIERCVERRRFLGLWCECGMVAQLGILEKSSKMLHSVQTIP